MFPYREKPIKPATKAGEATKRRGRPWFVAGGLVAVVAGLTGALNLPAVKVMDPQVAKPSQALADSGLSDGDHGKDDPAKVNSGQAGAVRGGNDGTDGDADNGPAGAGNRQRGQSDQRDDNVVGGQTKHVSCDPDKLIAAITLANADGGGTLQLADRCLYVLTTNQSGNGLPTIVEHIDVQGNNATIVRAAAAAQDFRIFAVASGGELNLHNVTITGGKDSSGDGGGAILVQDGGLVTITDATLRGNATTTNGGAITSRGTVKVTDSMVVDNTANGVNSQGGAIHASVGQLTVETSHVDHNYSRLSGGALYNSNAVVDVNDSTVSNNTADTGGGAYLSGDTKISRSTIANNHADTSGGGIRVGVAAPVTVRESKILGNTAGISGGGVFTSGNVLIQESKVDGNAALVSGGGVYNESALILRRSEVNGNKADGPSGKAAGILSANGTVSLVGSQVSGNVATLAPGGVGAGNNQFTVDINSLIVGNRPTNCQGSDFAVTGCFG